MHSTLILAILTACRFKWIRLFGKTLGILFNLSCFVLFWVIFNFFFFECLDISVSSRHFFYCKYFLLYFLSPFGKFSLLFKVVLAVFFLLFKFFSVLFSLKILSSEMDPAEIRLIRIFIKGSVSRFLEKSAHPDPLRAL